MENHSEKKLHFRAESAPLLIGGASRSGTTLLARILSKTLTETAVIPVEGYLDPYFRYWPYKMPMAAAKEFVKCYMTHLRPIDVKHTEGESVLDSSELGIEEYLKIPAGCNNPYELIDWSLQQYANAKGARSWGVKDTYQEVYFNRIVEHYTEAKLIIMMRDPRSSICSEMYAGTFPERNSQRSNSLSYRLFLWCLSVNSALQLKEKYPGSILIVHQEDLVLKPDFVNSQIRLLLNEPIGDFTASVLPKAFSSYEVKSTDFYRTNNKWKQLLSTSEVNLIEELAGDYMVKFGYDLSESTDKSKVTNKVVKIYLNFLLLITKKRPDLLLSFFNITMLGFSSFWHLLLRHIARILVSLRLINPAILCGRRNSYLSNKN